MEREKLAKLLEHWIDHDREHTAKYEEWAVKMKDTEPNISEGLFEAVTHFRQGETALEKVREML